MSQTPAFHGSDLEQVAQYYHLPQEEIICFSANVNPLGFPAKTAGLVCQNFSRLMTHYPDREYTGLKQAIGNYCHISAGICSCRKRFYRTDLSTDSVFRQKESRPGRSILLRIRAGASPGRNLLYDLVSQKGVTVPAGCGGTTLVSDQLRS